MQQLPALVGWIAASLAAGLVGSLVSPGAWYDALDEPSWNPPAWIFGPVWTVLYVVMGVAAWMVWLQRAAAPIRVRAALVLFGLQLALNALWSLIFFGLERPDLALAEIVVLWGAILATLLAFRRVSRWASHLLVPYLVWVTFATALNAAIWWLNRS